MSLFLALKLNLSPPKGAEAVPESSSAVALHSNNISQNASVCLIGQNWATWSLQDVREVGSWVPEQWLQGAEPQTRKGYENLFAARPQP